MAIKNVIYPWWLIYYWREKSLYECKIKRNDSTANDEINFRIEKNSPSLKFILALWLIQGREEDDLNIIKFRYFKYYFSERIFFRRKRLHTFNVAMTLVTYYFTFVFCDFAFTATRRLIFHIIVIIGVRKSVTDPRKDIQLEFVFFEPVELLYKNHT